MTRNEEPLDPQSVHEFHRVQAQNADVASPTGALGEEPGAAETPLHWAIVRKPGA